MKKNKLDINTVTREGLIQKKGSGDANRERFRLEKAIYSYCVKYLKIMHTENKSSFSMTWMIHTYKPDNYWGM